MAIEADCPIVLMAIAGTDQVLKRFPPRASVQIKVLPPLRPQPDETPLALTDRLMFTLAQAPPEEMRGVYREVPNGFEMKM